MGTIDAGVPAYHRHLRRTAILASSGAAAVHLGAVHPHLMEYRPAAYFMLISGLAQFVWAVLVARDVSPRRVALLGAMGNAAIIGLWLMSRTVGLPVGPEPWVAEHIHPTDQLATLLEVLVVIACVARVRPQFFVRARFLAALSGGGVLACVFTTSHEPAYERAVAFATLALAGGLIAFVSVLARSMTVRPLGRGNEISLARHRFDRFVVAARASAGARG